MNLPHVGGINTHYPATVRVSLGFNTLEPTNKWSARWLGIIIISHMEGSQDGGTTKRP